MSSVTLPDLRRRISDLLPRDEHRLGRRLEGTRAIRDEQARTAALQEIEAEVEAARQRLDARLAAVPVVRYPEELPVSARRDDIAAAIRDHQVVVVAGETGSGKTTQLPKICLELGRGVRGQIESPRSWTRRWAPRSGTRCGSPTRSPSRP
jgi:ATP-dependent helicase HrpA